MKYFENQSVFVQINNSNGVFEAIISTEVRPRILRFSEVGKSFISTNIN